MSRAAVYGGEQFLELARKGERFENVLLTGEEGFLLDLARREFLTLSVTPQAREFDYIEMRVNETDGETVWGALTILPFMAERRTVVLDWTKDAGDSVVEALARYLHQPSPSTLLVMIGDPPRDERLKEGLQKSTSIVTFDRLRDERSRAAWAQKWVKGQGKTIERDALSYLIQTSSASLAELAGKLEHTVLYAGDHAEITLHMVMRVCGVTSEYTIFQLEDAILEQDASRAHKIARALLEGGEVLLPIIAMHRNLIMRLWKVSVIANGRRKPEPGESLQDLWRSVLGGQAWKREQYERAARRHGEASIRRALRGLLEVEYQLKSSPHGLTGYYEWLWQAANSTKLEPRSGSIG